MKGLTTEALAMVLSGIVLPMAVPVAFAQDTAGETAPVELAGEAIVDLVSVVQGGSDRKVRSLTNVNLTADLNLYRIGGWQGGRAHLHVLDNRGARPNDAALTLQGVDNIEVPDAGLRLFEAWLEQDIGNSGASLRRPLRCEQRVLRQRCRRPAAGSSFRYRLGIGRDRAERSIDLSVERLVGPASPPLGQSGRLHPDRPDQCAGQHPW